MPLAINDSYFPTRITVLAGLERDQEALAEFVDCIGPEVLHVVEAAAYKNLNRYNLRPGRFFGKKDNPEERFRVAELAGNVVVYRNLRTGHSESADLEELLEWWNDAGYVEITRWDDILAVIKKYLTPFLGSVIVGALVTWLLGRLK